MRKLQRYTFADAAQPLCSCSVLHSARCDQHLPVCLTSITDGRLIQVIHLEYSHDSCASYIWVRIPQTLLDWRHLRIIRPINLLSENQQHSRRLLGLQCNLFMGKVSLYFLLYISPSTHGLPLLREVCNMMGRQQSICNFHWTIYVVHDSTQHA